MENRLTNFNNTIYIAYNGDGVRVRKISGTTTNYYLVDDRNPSSYAQVLEEHQALSGQSPALKRVYNYGLDLVSQREAAGTVYYFGYDGHGSTRLLIDTGGTAIQKFSYDAYGTLIDSDTAPATVYLYGGEQFDPDLGFYYQRARYLNPNTGRFWTMDSYSGNNEDPLSLHKYLYCQADPVNNVDPSGLLVKHAARDLNGVPIGTHQFLILIPDNPSDFQGNSAGGALVEALGAEMKAIGGKQVIVVGAHNVSGRLRVKFLKDADAAATKRGIGPRLRSLSYGPMGSGGPRYCCTKRQKRYAVHYCDSSISAELHHERKSC